MWSLKVKQFFLKIKIQTISTLPRDSCWYVPLTGNDNDFFFSRWWLFLLSRFFFIFFNYLSEIHQIVTFVCFQRFFFFPLDPVCSPMFWQLTFVMLTSEPSLTSLLFWRSLGSCPSSSLFFYSKLKKTCFVWLKISHGLNLLIFLYFFSLVFR